MTRQHFEALASDIGLTLRRIDQRDGDWKAPAATAGIHELSLSIAATCAASNPRFNRQRFMDRIDQVRKDGLK